MGRTLAGGADQLPSVSVGILSALDRIWGKAMQTDAKVSPTNYGGPLIDLYGRVQGVLVPASPRAEGETAGFEWYDSGIGFAIPLEDVNRVLPRMLKGTKETPVNLKRGLLGITMQQSQDPERRRRDHRFRLARLGRREVRPEGRRHHQGDRRQAGRQPTAAAAPPRSEVRGRCRFPENPARQGGD